MMNKAEYQRNFPVDIAYQFLKDNELSEESDTIQFSRDRCGSYTTTLKRAKIIRLLSNKNLIDKYIDSCWPSGRTPKGQRRINFWLKLYDRFTEGAEEMEVGEEEDNNEDQNFDESRFAYENDLRDYLANNLHLIERGLNLYEENGVRGIEFTIDNSSRRIDILAIDNTGIPVVIELKVSRGHERTIGQVLYYQSMVKKRLGTQSTRAVIVAHEISEELRIASESIPNIELFEYKLSMELQRVPDSST